MLFLIDRKESFRIRKLVLGLTLSEFKNYQKKKKSREFGSGKPELGEDATERRRNKQALQNQKDCFGDA